MMLCPRDLTTWSVVAADPRTGEVGVALASCVPVHPDALIALVPGRGAGAVQGAVDLRRREALTRALEAGAPAGEAVAAADAAAPGSRHQLGAAAIAPATAATLTAPGAGAGAGWSGGRADPPAAVAVQGNSLASPAVVRGAHRAFEDAQKKQLPLAERLLRALEAGSAAGGDARCGAQTAAGAVLAVARPGDPPYALSGGLGDTDQGTPEAPWLLLSVAEPLGGDNPVRGLRRRYDRWRLRATDHGSARQRR